MQIYNSTIDVISHGLLDVGADGNTIEP